MRAGPSSPGSDGRQALKAQVTKTLACVACCAFLSHCARSATREGEPPSAQLPGASASASAPPARPMADQTNAEASARAPLASADAGPEADSSPQGAEVDPKTLAAAKAFLHFYVTGDGTELGLPRVPGARRRAPALLGPPPEYEPLDRPQEPSAPGEPYFVDMAGLEDVLLLESEGQLTLVLFWCTSYPRAELQQRFKRLPRYVTRIHVPSASGEAESVAAEISEKLESFLGEEFQTLGLERQIELVEFEELAARKSGVVGAVSRP